MENKKMPIWKIILIILVAIGFCCLIYFLGNSKETTSTEQTAADATAMVARAQEESSSVKDSEKKELNEISIDTYLEYYSGSEEKLVLIARPTCTYCQIAEPILQKLSYDNDFTIDYLNTDNLDEDGQSKFVNSDDRFKEGYGTPMLVIVANNSIVDIVDGLADKAGYTAFLKGHSIIK